MARRAYWKGFLKLSLVSCPIMLYPATSDREKVHFHQINRNTGHRIRYHKVDAATGDEVPTSDIVNGYEIAKGKFIELERDELDAVAIESKRTIEIDRFVERTEIDELYLRDPYFITPDGDAGEEPFAVIREAIRREALVALGTVVLTSREHVIAIEARGKGMLGLTLRYPYEVRRETDYFRDIANKRVSKEMLDLALHIVATKRGKFEPEKFDDRYEDALKALVRKKQKGHPIEVPKEAPASNVINLMDALRGSLKHRGRQRADHGHISRSRSRARKRAG
jgi:DNA end-binding protein Ku